MNDHKLLVNNVFNNTAEKYDCMNDILSFGLHRLWKKHFVKTSNALKANCILDLAGGSGDVTFLAKKSNPKAEIWHTDINQNMLELGQNRLINAGMVVNHCLCDAELLPFENEYFDTVFVAFGLRNFTSKRTALNEIYRVLQPKGELNILEFSKVKEPFNIFHEKYLKHLVPFLGSVIAKNKSSYEYLADSIEKHPNQQQLKELIQDVGFQNVEYLNLSLGIVAIHRGYKSI